MHTYTRSARNARTRRKQLTHKGTHSTDANIRKELLIIQQGARAAKKKFVGDLSDIVPDFLVESPPRDV